MTSDEEIEKWKQERITTLVVRCRYVQPDGVGYLDAESRCTRDLRYAKKFDHEADAWTFAGLSGERVPDDCWVEPFDRNHPAAKTEIPRMEEEPQT